MSSLAQTPSLKAMQFNVKPIRGTKRDSGDQSPQSDKPKIKPLLTQALADTLSGKLNWTHRQEARGTELVDTFSAKRRDVNIHLSATRPEVTNTDQPELLGQWELKLEKIGKKPAILDGPHLHLPQTVSEATDTEANIIPKLFKSVYEASAQQYDPLQATINTFLDKLTRGEMSCSLTRLKPDFRYNLPTGAKIAQIGEGNERLEVSRVGNTLLLKIHQGKNVERHSEAALQNESVRAVLDALLEEVHLQRTGKTGKGLSSF